LYILLVVVVGLIGKLIWDWYKDDEEEVEFSDLLDAETIEQGAAERQLLNDIAESHKTVTAPAAIEWETRAARVGEQWTTTLYIADYPDYPNDGYLSELFEMTDVQFDLTAHITPKNQERARNELQEIADDLQVDADLEQSVRSAYLQERANEAAATYKAVENGANVFDQGMYITVRADEKEDLRDAVQKVKSA
ncbi:transferase, partial [Halorubrum ezzemoulense]